MATNVLLRDMNVDVPLTDGRRIEVLANGLPIWQGAQAAVDTTLVSAQPHADRGCQQPLQVVDNALLADLTSALEAASIAVLQVPGFGGFRMRLGFEGFGLRMMSNPVWQTQSCMHSRLTSGF